MKTLILFALVFLGACQLKPLAAQSSTTAENSCENIKPEDYQSTHYALHVDKCTFHLESLDQPGCTLDGTRGEVNPDASMEVKTKASPCFITVDYTSLCSYRQNSGATQLSIHCKELGVDGNFFLVTQ